MNDTNKNLIKYDFAVQQNTLPSTSYIYQNTEKKERNESSLSRKHQDKPSEISQQISKSGQLDDYNTIDKNTKKNSQRQFGNQIPDLDVKNIGNVIQEYSDNEDKGFKMEYAV